MCLLAGAVLMLGMISHADEARAATCGPPCPALLSVTASAASASTANVSATVFTYGFSTIWSVELGTSAGVYELGSFPGGIAPGDASGGTPVTTTLSSLTPGIVYHYRLAASSLGGSNVSDDRTFTIDPCSLDLCPSIDNARTTSVGTETARIEANVFPRSSATQWSVQYGTTAAYGTTVVGGLVSPPGPVPVAVELAGLAPRTTYHYRLVATNAEGTTESAGTTFTTVDPCTVDQCPAIGPVTIVGTGFTDAAVSFSLFTRSASTSWHVEYGRTTAYGAVTAPVVRPAETNPYAEGFSLTGLDRDAGYHFRIVATSSRGTTTSPDFTFATKNPCDFDQCPAIASARATPTALDKVLVTLNVGTRGSDTDWVVDYGPTAAYGVTVVGPSVEGDLTGVSDVGVELTGLTPGQPYHWRVRATNANGTTFGPDGTFSIDPCLLHLCPTIAATATRDVEHDRAVVETTIDTRSFPASWHVEYGTSPTLGSRVDGTPIPGDLTGGSSVALPLTDLVPLTTYSYRVVAETAAGTATSAVKTFTTGAAPDPCEIALCPSGSLEPVSRHSRRVLLTGELFTYGSPTTWAVEYGPTTAYGSLATGLALPAGEANAASPIEIELAGLDPSTTYHYRIVATNAAGTGRSGADTFTTTAGFQNIEALDWQRGPDLPKPWFAFTGSRLDNRIFVAGNDPLGRTYSLDPFGVDDEWLLEPSTAPYYTQEEGSANLDGMLWVVGSGHLIGDAGLTGVITQVYDADAHTWSLGAALPDQRPRFAPALAVAGGTLYLFGGRTVPGPGSADFHADGWMLASDRSHWVPVAPPPVPVSDAAIATGLDGRIYLFGGISCGGPGPVPGTCSRGAVVDRVQAYDPATGTWTQETPLPSARYGAAAAVVGLGILVVGGLDELPTLNPSSGVNTYPPALRTVSVYEYSGDRWLTSPPTLERHEEHAVISIGRELWVVGGRSTEPLVVTEYVTAAVIVKAVPSPAVPDGASGWYRTTPTLDVDASNGVGGPAELRYGFGGWSAHAYTGAVAVAVPDGVQTFHYGARDAVGNASAIATRTLRVDTVAPTLSVVRSGGNFTATVSDAASGVERVEFAAVTATGIVAVATDSTAPYTASFALFPAGTQAIQATAFDRAGHETTVTTPVAVLSACIDHWHPKLDKPARMSRGDLNVRFRYCDEDDDDGENSHGRRHGPPAQIRVWKLNSVGVRVAEIAVTPKRPNIGDAFRREGSHMAYHWDLRLVAAGRYRVYALVDGIAEVAGPEIEIKQKK